MSKLKLSDVKWKEFKISSLFDICTGRDLILSGINTGEIPVITHKENDNGINMFSEYLVSKRLMTSKDTISLADRGTFKAHAQPYDFYIGTRVKGLKLQTPEVSKYALLFISVAINKQKELFSYGRNACQRLEVLNIMLPVDVNGDPDWQFMEDYIKQERGVQVRKLVDYYKSKVSECDIKDLSGMEWKEFWLEDITEIKPGIRLTKADQLHGKLPFVGSSDNNNGITGFVSNINSSLDSNVLGVNYNGSIVDNYYHPYKCIFSDDVKRLHLKEKKAQNK